LSLTESLKALKTDYIDVFMLHYADLEILEIDELYEVFEELSKEGLIRYPGISVYEEKETKRALDKGFWSVLQLPFNLMDQKQGVHFQKAHENGVGLVIRSVLMRGLLTDKSFQLHPELKAVENHIQLYKQLFDSEMESLVALAMKFTASIPEIASVLVGFDKIAFVDQALEIFNGKNLNEDQLKLAKSLSYPDQGFLNLAKWDKNGWL
ncbi:MAG: aldo/keto reductase, partial [Sphingobacterium sp.]